MKKSGTLLKSILAVILSSLMVLSTLGTAFAAQIIDEEQTLQYLNTFNDAVNAIKEEKPSFTYYKKAEMNKDRNNLVIGSKTAADISDDARKYLGILIDAFFNPEKGLVNNFLAVMTDTGSNDTTKEIYKGLDAGRLLPVSGKDYVSALTAEDEFTLFAEEIQDYLNPENNSTKIRFAFEECDLENVKDSSLKKVFDLPSGAINPVLIGSDAFDEENDPLDEIKFDNFKYHDAYVQAELDADNQLSMYEQRISYTFSISFYDMIRIFSVYTKIDLMDIGLAIANPILQGTGNPEVTAREVLKDTVMFIQYDVLIRLTDFDWNPRFFGDIDNNGGLDANDSRKALRYSVGLEKIRNDSDLIFADVDFDGVVSAADAREILRMTVGLDEAFSEVPEGETIKIVVITPPEDELPEMPDTDDIPDIPDIPEIPENPGDPENPDGEEGPQLPSFDDVTGGVSDFITSIFDIVNGFKGDGVSNEGITSIVQNIKDIIAAAKGDIPQQKPEGGIIVEPETTENA